MLSAARRHTSGAVQKAVELGSTLLLPPLLLHGEAFFVLALQPSASCDSRLHEEEEDLHVRRSGRTNERRAQSDGM